MLLAARNRQNFFRGIGERVERFLEDSYQALGSILTVSRLKYKPEPFNYALHGELIADLKGEHGLNFEAVCEKRAVEILDLFRASGMSTLHVMWSGGIDSTLALLSLLRYWNAADAKAIRLISTQHSINEYPWLWFQRLRGRVRITSGAEGPFDRFFDDALVLTGELGDQIFGSDIYNQILTALGQESLWQDDYRDCLIRNFTRKLGARASRFVAMFEPIAEECPFKIKNAVDFLWFWNFTQKWQHVKYRALLFSTEQYLRRNASRMVHFYESEDFQRWSIEHHAEKITSDWQSYKWPAKELIVKFTGDQNYYKKTKAGSLQWMASYHQWRIALTENYEYVEQLNPFVRSGWHYGGI